MMATGLFKVTDLGTVQNPVCNFLLANNTNLFLSLTIFELLRSIGQIITFDRGCLNVSEPQNCGL